MAKSLVAKALRPSPASTERDSAGSDCDKPSSLLMNFENYPHGIDGVDNPDWPYGNPQPLPADGGIKVVTFHPILTIPYMSKPRTLDKALQRIAELEAQLTGKPAPTNIVAPSAVTRTPSARNVNTVLANTAAKAEGFETFVKIVKHANLEQLREMAADVCVSLRSANNQVEATKIAKKLGKVDKQIALAIYADKEAWAKRYQYLQD